jgi:hypothetical protein
MRSGELIVTGTNSATIALHNFPSEVRVHFKDDGPEAVPCDPGSADTLQYEVLTATDGSVALVISWVVSSVREIKWRASY